MVTLVCALVGVAGSAFAVDIEGSKLVAQLKDAIKAYQMFDFPASKLQLFLAQKDGAWLNGDNADAVTLETVSTSFVKMDPLLWIKNAKYFGDKFKPNEGEVHVLVVVPPDAGGSASEVTATSLTVDQVKMAVDSVLEERDRKRSAYSISTCPRSKEELLKQKLGFRYSVVVVKEVVNDSISGYQWSELTEKHPEQRKAYFQYVEEHLRDALVTNREQKDFLRDVAGLKDLLDCDDRSRLPFKVKGTADMMIIDEHAQRINDFFAGLRFVIEVKKGRPGPKEQWQMLLELVVADLKSEERCAPVGLLTNLNDYWYFLWFTTDNNIARMVLTCPANGFQMMKEVLKERGGPLRDGSFSTRIAFLESPLALKRRKLPSVLTAEDAAAAEMLERYELMSDELSPEFLRERRLDYALRLVSQMPIHSAMYS